MCLRPLLSFIIAMILVSQGLSQNVDNVYSKDVLPPTPETAAFGKNLAIPMSYGSGTPQINIPIATVKSGGLQLPISINYNAAGVRVEETPTWVGQGWSLSAGGMITRSVREDPDEGAFGYMVVPANRHVAYLDSALCWCIYPGGTTIDWQVETEHNYNHQLDLEPDSYTYSVMGYSGDFYYDQDSAKFVTVPYQNIIIQGAPGNFTLILPDGTKAFFGGSTTTEETLESGLSDAYVDGMVQATTGLPHTPYGTSWMLQQVQETSGKSIFFSYDIEREIVFSRGTEKYGQTITDNFEVMRRQSFSRQFFKKPVLTQIVGESGTVAFYRSARARLDIANQSDSCRSLDSIVITNSNGLLIKNFILTHDYSVSPVYSTTGIQGIAQFAEQARRRLRLTSVREKNGSQSLPPYEFTYSAMQLPSRFSTSQDYWGFFNGKTNGVYMMPRLAITYFNPVIPNSNEVGKILPPYGAYILPSGADRRVDTIYSQAGILIQIKYPTGGTTSYTYESNEAASTYLNMYNGIEVPDMVDKSLYFGSLASPIPVDPPYPTYFSSTFHVNLPSTELKIVPNMATCSLVPDAACKVLVKLRHLPDSALISTINTNSTIYPQVPTGDYVLEAFINAPTSDYPLTFSVNVSWGERRDSFSFKAGGVRVKKIKSEDGLGGSVTRSFSYLLPGTRASSGVVDGSPTFVVHDDVGYGASWRRYYVSNSVIPLSNEGRTVRYLNVSEFYDTAQTSFKIDYTFTGMSAGVGVFAQPQTGAPVQILNWQNNLLRRKQIYERRSTSLFRILSDEETFFTFVKPSFKVYGLFGNQMIQYYVQNEWYMPDSSHILAYSYPNDIASTQESFSKTIYNSYQLPSATRSRNSKGQTLLDRLWYPTDFNNITGYFIDSMKSRHMLTLPIKQETSANGKLIVGSVTKYSVSGSPIQHYAYENVALTDTIVHSPSIYVPANYNSKVNLFYNASGDLTQIAKPGSQNSSIIWSSDNLNPIAQVLNADSASIAFTSFEQTGSGLWNTSFTSVVDNFAMTGRYDYVLSAGSILKTGLSSTKTYVVSYWKKSSGTVSVNAVTPAIGKTVNGWTYYEHKVVNPASGVITVSGSATIDELRLYPEKAQMTSFVLEPLVGILAQNDANNNITRYEYDRLNRLIFVRDESGNIVKRICYNYKGQASDCGYGVAAAWTATSSVCETSGGINTGNLLVTEKDMNSASSTYNQTRVTTITSGCVVCNGTTCVGEGRKCINNVCETGFRINVSRVRLTSTTWQCSYKYQFSDGSYSSTYTEIVGFGECVVF